MGFGTLIQKITYKISGRSLSASGLYTPQDYLYDYAVGGVPFLSATSDTRPDTEKPVQQRKQQFDNYKDPGEYSLNQWWLRSQSSFVGGAGVTYQDPDTQGTALNVRYHQSVGIDPFTDPDIIQLLKEVNESTAFVSSSIGNVAVKAFDDGTVNQSGRVWISEYSGKITKADVNTADIANLRTTTIPGPCPLPYIENYTSPGLPAAFDDHDYALIYSDDVANGGLYKVLDNIVSISATKIYTRFVSPFSLPVKAMTLARGRVYINVGSQLFALDPNAAPATAWPAAIASVPGDQIIVSITDGPDAIYVAANNDRSGFIYKTTFDSSGIVNGLTQVAVLPDGERINCIAAYIATYLVISTMTSIRVGNFTGTGITYGPPVVQVPIDATGGGGTMSPGVGVYTSGFGKIQFFGTKAYVTTQTQHPLHGDAQGIMAVDLSVINTDNNTNSEANAYSTWVYNPTTELWITDLTVTKDGRLLYGSSNGTFVGATGHLWVEHATNRISEGFLDTGRCRFNTIEPKLFKYFSIRTPTPLNGDVQVAVIDDQGALTNYITYGPTVDPGTGDIATPAPPGPRNYESLRFTLKRNASDLSVGGVIDSWQIKALPGVLKQRVITRQFLCFNSEKDKSGQIISGDTSSLDRLTAIRQMCQRGDTVTLQDLVNNISDQVIIDDYQFTMLSSPGPNGENYGGYLTVIMRTVADAVPPISVSGSGLDDE